MSALLVYVNEYMESITCVCERIFGSASGVVIAMLLVRVWLRVGGSNVCIVLHCFAVWMAIILALYSKVCGPF